jgi:hypothetical protein
MIDPWMYQCCAGFLICAIIFVALALLQKE